MKSLDRKSNVEHQVDSQPCACQSVEAMHFYFYYLPKSHPEATGDRKQFSIKIQQNNNGANFFFFWLGSVNKCLKLFITIVAVSVCIGQPNG